MISYLNQYNLSTIEEIKEYEKRLKLDYTADGLKIKKIIEKFYNFSIWERLEAKGAHLLRNMRAFCEEAKNIKEKIHLICVLQMLLGHNMQYIYSLYKQIVDDKIVDIAQIYN